MLDEWGGDDVDELFELLETQLGDVGIDLKYEAKEGAVVAEAEEEDEEDDDFDDEDEDDEDDEDEDEEEEEEDDEV
jgi:hypothetical protein